MNSQNSDSGFYIPPVALTFAVFQIAIYLTSNWYISSEEDIWVSWVKVVDELQLWRLMIAHYFHFTRTRLFWSVVTLITVGRYLERKLTMPAVIAIINLNGIMSNLVFVFVNLIICPLEQSLKLSESSYGFTNLTYGLRVILAYIQEPRNYKANSLYGLYPVVLPANLAPWQPFLEIIVLKICLPEGCVAYALSSTFSGLLLSLAIHLLPQDWVFLSTNSSENDEDGINSSSNDSSGLLSPALSMEVMRAIQTNHLKINQYYTNQNGIIRPSLLQQDVNIISSLRFQLMLHKQLQRQAFQRGGKC